jgi:S-adenosylmethionine/arginine decarboxylase-like enzyme
VTTTAHTTEADPQALPDGAWGREVTIDMSGCDPAVIRDSVTLADWARHLVDEIGMEAHGEPIVQLFGVGATYGHTVIQLITTSNIMVHTTHDDNTAFVNVFSCRDFSVDAAVAFTVGVFGARAFTVNDTLRIAPPVRP